MRKVFILMIALMVISAPAFANLVVNGDFETGDLTGWQTWAAGWSVNQSSIINTVQAPFGTYCVRVGVDSGEGSHGLYQVVPVQAGLEHDFSMWVRSMTNMNNWTEVLLYDYAVTDINDIDDGAKAGPHMIWKRDSWGGVAGLPGGMLPTVATVPGPGNSWEYVNGSITSSTGYVTIAYKWGRSGGGFTGAGFIDEVSLTPVPEPGSMLALGTGLAGLAGFVIRRRR